MNIRTKLAAALLAAAGTTSSHASGITVIDIANLVQTIQQVLNYIT
jgi:type IV secretion system protein VirB5